MLPYAPGAKLGKASCHPEQEGGEDSSSPHKKPCNSLLVNAPLETHDRNMIGYAIGPEEAYCADMTVDEFMTVGPSIYVHVNTPRAFHGLKRIWEFMDAEGLRTNEDTDKYIDIQKIIHTKLIAVLLPHFLC